MQDIGALARLATKLLTKQLGDIGLVIDNQDADALGYLPPLLLRRCLAPGVLGEAIS
jgi:hypothetical protein